MSMKLAYFVHDLADAAVKRRVRMLTIGGADIRVAGFKRARHISSLSVPYVELGQTVDAKLASRALAVVRTLANLEAVEGVVRGADIVIARNLEMLAIASRARDRFAPGAKLIYECLDIHRLLLSRSAAGYMLRAMESRLWRKVDLLLTSSPAFVENYFAPRGFPARIELVENKVLAIDATIQTEKRVPVGPPWRIGYFGMLRCRKSIDILATLAKEAGGTVEVVIRGKPSPAVFPHFEAELEAMPHVRFLGAYNGEADLPRIYADVHFTWAIDFYEESQNSSWLLPNRLYEGCYFGAVPIALSEVETGRWLSRYHAGICIRDPIDNEIARFFSDLDIETYESLARQVHQIPRKALVAGPEDVGRLLSALLGGPTQVFAEEPV